MSEPLTTEQAEAVYDILVEHAGASEYGREGFVYLQTHGHLPEYRFIGALGFGGKFWRDAWDDGISDRWRVSCYPEDATPDRMARVTDANVALADLRAQAGA